MSAADRSDDVVTVVRLVSLGRADRGGANSGIVTTLGQASIRTEGDSFLLVTRDTSALRRLRVGDIVHWVADPLGVVWRAEQPADDAGMKESGQ
jgi:hypothetical protein